jgi:DNA cross-link repair 1A protein
MATQNAALKRLAAPLDHFIVDGFNFIEPDVHHYFLTHAHSDHTCGLHASFDVGTIYCSPLTARVLRATLGTKQKLIRTFDIGETIEVEGVRVTALDAGHCPGSLMFLFHHVATGHIALHTGDCRASPVIVDAAVAAARIASTTAAALVLGATATAASQTANTAAATAREPAGGLVHTIYLDTTYWQPRWSFPPQEDSLRMLETLVAAELGREPRTLFLVGSYQIGKEKAIAAVARAASGRALVPARRAVSLRLCHAWDDTIHTEVDADDVRVHVSPLGGMGQEAHEQMLAMVQASNGRYVAVVSIRPTGWTYTRALRSGRPPKPWIENDGTTRLYGVPYSEHSSYT